MRKRRWSDDELIGKDAERFIAQVGFASCLTDSCR
jgi:hypothetical protein